MGVHDMTYLRNGLLLALWAISSTGNAIIIRDDVDDKQYRVPAATLPALADFHQEGHGVLIAPQWVVTAAHVACMHPNQDIVINGVPRKVDAILVHRGYKTPPEELVKEVLASGDGARLRAFLASSDDIALVRLAAPVSDVTPVPLYGGGDELGKTVQLIGKGATGDGSKGIAAHSPHRTALRRAYNVISSVDSRWISYTFDAPRSALPLEGMSGNGDSGGPLLIQRNEHWELAGLVAWVSSERDIRSFRGARYGDGGNNVRISHYKSWIESTISAEDKKRDRPPAER